MCRPHQLVWSLYRWLPSGVERHGGSGQKVCNLHELYFWKMFNQLSRCDVARRLRFGIKISPYRKPTAIYSILAATPCHSPHVIKNMTVGELLWRKRNSLCMETWGRKSNTCSWLRQLQYPYWMLKRAKGVVADIPCEDLLKNTNKQKHKLDSICRGIITKKPITFVTTYTPQYTQITNIIKKNICQSFFRMTGCIRFLSLV